MNECWLKIIQYKLYSMDFSMPRTRWTRLVPVIIFEILNDNHKTKCFKFTSSMLHAMWLQFVVSSLKLKFVESSWKLEIDYFFYQDFYHVCISILWWNRAAYFLSEISCKLFLTLLALSMLYVKSLTYNSSLLIKHKF